MITTSTLWLDMSMGLLSAGVVLGALLLLTWWDRRRQERAAAQLHVAQHRALDASPVEVIRVGPPTLVPAVEERTEEMPRVAVAHVEAAEEQPEDGAIGTMAADESPEMADAAWRHAHDQRWTALLVDWATRPPWLAEFSDANLHLPEYRRLVLEHTGEISMADLIAAGVR